MVAIKDMEMPKSCSNCDFCVEDKYADMTCVLLGSEWEETDYNDNHIDENCPLVEIEERKVGEWCKQNDDYFDWYECSECGYGSEGEMQYSSEYDVRTKYCPNCGAEMVGTKNE